MALTRYRCGSAFLLAFCVVLASVCLGVGERRRSRGHSDGEHSGGCLLRAARFPPRIHRRHARDDASLPVNSMLAQPPFRRSTSLTRTPRISHARSSHTSFNRASRSLIVPGDANYHHTRRKQQLAHKQRERMRWRQQQQQLVVTEVAGRGAPQALTSASSNSGPLFASPAPIATSPGTTYDSTGPTSLSPPSDTPTSPPPVHAAAVASSHCKCFSAILENRGGCASLSRLLCRLCAI